MKGLKQRLTYANVMSSIAVFLVLGGTTAFAANQLGKNSVGTKQLKKSAVTTGKIKKNAVNTARIRKNAVTTGKIRAEAVTGAKIKLSTVGTVPSASVAATAGQLNGLSRRGIVSLSPTTGASEEAALAAAPETPLLSAGSISLYAKCVSYGTTVKAIVFVKTSVNGAIFYGETDNLAGDPAFLNVGTPENEREVAYESAGVGQARNLEAEDILVFAMSPDGTAVQGLIPLAVKNGALPEGNGVYGSGSCLFSGSLLQTS